MYIKLILDLSQHGKMIKGGSMFGQGRVFDFAITGDIAVQIDAITTSKSISHRVVENRVVGGDDKVRKS